MSADKGDRALGQKQVDVSAAMDFLNGNGTYDPSHKAAFQSQGSGALRVPHGLSIVGLAGEDQPLTPGDHRYGLSVDGKERQFEIHVPKGYDGSKPLPVIYMMGGVGGGIDQMKHETGMNRLADQRGFAVAYTQALPKDFPDTLGWVKSPAWNLDHGALTDKVAGYDDVNYMKAVDQAVKQHIKVDKSSEYIAGFSEGGGAAQYVAQQMRGTFAGVGSVHGTYLEGDPRPQPGDPTAFISIHSDNDNMFAVSGGHGVGEGWRPVKGFMTLPFGKVSQSEPLAQAKIWAQADGAGAPVVHDNGKDKVTDYTGGSAPVREIIRHGGQHAWDGLGQNANNYVTGKPDFGWAWVGEPNPSENTSKDLVDALMRFHKKI